MQISDTSDNAFFFQIIHSELSYNQHQYIEDLLPVESIVFLMVFRNASLNLDKLNTNPTDAAIFKMNTLK